MQFLHATLYNAQAEGINVKAFKWTIYKGKISNNVVVKSIEKLIQQLVIRLRLNAMSIRIWE
mgnify:CR=1 FL=1